LNTPSPIKMACIIDDDDLYINLVKKIIDLKKLSENLLIFKNGKEALDYFTRISKNIEEVIYPEIILLDLNMPVMDGWGFLRNFAQIEPLKSIPTSLYIVSSSVDPVEIERAKSDTLVTDYLIKPLNLKEFEVLFSQKSA